MKLDAGDKQSLTAQVYKQLRNDILEGRYETGAFLVETKLADELGVSRTPIREALKQLELEDLVVAIPNKGVTVQGISEQDINDIFTIRHLLEGQAAYWAAERVNDEQMNKLTETLALMDMYTERNDATNLARLDSQFHDTIFSASNSRMLKHILTSLHQNTQRVRRFSLSVPERSHKSTEEHKAIFKAIEAHDPVRAKKLMESHIMNVKK